MTTDELLIKLNEATTNLNEVEAAYRIAKTMYQSAQNEYGAAMARELYKIEPGDIVIYTSREGFNGKTVTRRIIASSFSYDAKYKQLSIFGRAVTKKGEMSDQADVFFYHNDKSARQQFVKRELKP